MYYFLSDSGERLPITNMFDVDGDEVSDPKMAVVIVARQSNGKWLTSECDQSVIVEAGN